MIEYACMDESFAFFVPVEAPGVHGAIRQDFESLFHRMVAPDRTAEGLAILFRGSRFSDVRGFLDAMSAVEPAVGPPFQAVEKIVFRFSGPAVEDDFGRSIGDVVSVRIRDEKQLRRIAEPDPAESDLKTARVIALIPEDFA